MPRKTIIRPSNYEIKWMYFLSSQKFKMQTHFNLRFQSYNKITEMSKATQQHKKVLELELIFDEKRETIFNLW